LNLKDFYLNLEDLLSFDSFTGKWDFLIDPMR